GDDVPPDELNHAPKAGMHFGYPYCHGGDIADPEFGARHPCSDFTPPAKKFGAHVASLGVRFYTGTMFPSDYRNRLFIAEHGSWNRSKKSGYRVMQAKIDGDRVVDYEVFAEGFLDRGKDAAWGRPVDLLVMPDGAMLVSDDHANAIYRIAFNKVMAVAPDAPIQRMPETKPKAP
ncbi:MAG: PQQ-dependent sugar dehydrogenase, partial [Usitatibacter sp.]